MISRIDILGYSCEIVLPQSLTDDLVNIGSGNGLVPSGTKPLLKPLLIQIYVAIWHL